MNPVIPQKLIQQDINAQVQFKVPVKQFFDLLTAQNFEPFHEQHYQEACSLIARISAVTMQTKTILLTPVVIAGFICAAGFNRWDAIIETLDLYFFRIGAYLRQTDMMVVYNALLSICPDLNEIPAIEDKAKILSIIKSIISANHNNDPMLKSHKYIYDEALKKMRFILNYNDFSTLHDYLGQLLSQNYSIVRAGLFDQRQHTKPQSAQEKTAFIAKTNEMLTARIIRGLDELLRELQISQVFDGITSVIFDNEQQDALALSTTEDEQFLREFGSF